MSSSSANSGLNLTALLAVMRRQLSSLLGNPLGYVFILGFVLVNGATLFLFQGDKYFARNIADLALLQPWMPWFLAVLLPALAMGSWASERDSGTEELLLTLPMSIADAILGKFLAVAAYFTIALVCSLSNVIVVDWLGDPDYGLIAANYLGWWLAGLGFAALGVLASVLVSLPAVAFVIGIMFSGIALWAAQSADWFDAFNRGVAPLGHIGAALALMSAALGSAVFILSSRRWRPSSKGTVVAQVLSLTFGLLLLVNVARLANKGGVDADITSEGLASISQTSRTVLADVNDPVQITAFISQDLPPELALKAKEVQDKLKALERARPGQIKVVIHRPVDALDKLGTMAAKEYNLKPRKSVIETVSGREFADVFLGAAVRSGARMQVIEHFDPGLSVEYEMVRAIRGVATIKKKVLGIATTDLDINGGFDYQSGQMNQPWEIVREWQKQYEVRGVNLDSPVAADIDVLVVPQPSSLIQAQLENLHAAIWAGKPTMILEDPMPYFSIATGRSDLLPGQPKKSANPMGGQQGQEAGPPKGDIKLLWKSLGLDFDETQVLWSDYNPSHQFRNLIPPTFVWTSRDQKGVQDATATTGINSLLIPFPGQILPAKDKPASLEVKTLITPTPQVPWGRHRSEELGEKDWMGRFSMKEPKTRYSGDKANPPAMAVAVTGTMLAAWPVANPAYKPEAKKADDKDAKKDEAKKDDAEPEKKAGIASTKPINVIVIADVDFVNNEFFAFYRNTGNKFAEDELRFLLNLRNVQLAANSIDALASDSAYLDLRNRRAERRPLKKMEDQMLLTQEKLRSSLSAADMDAEMAVTKANESFQGELRKIDDNKDLDENAKAHEKAMAQVREQRKLDLAQVQINEVKEAKIRDAKAEQRLALKGDRDQVKLLAITIPAIVLALLVLVVWTNRLRAERAHIPTSRKRAA